VHTRIEPTPQTPLARSPGAERRGSGCWEVFVLENKLRERERVRERARESEKRKTTTFFHRPNTVNVADTFAWNCVPGEWLLGGYRTGKQDEGERERGREKEREKRVTTTFLSHRSHVHTS